MIRSMLRRLTVGRWPTPLADEELSCSDVARYLQPYLDEEVTDEAALAAVAAHLEACRRCGLEAETYAAIKSALAARRPAIDPESVERLRAFGASLTDGRS